MKYVSYQLDTPVGKLPRIGYIREEKIVDIKAIYRLYLRECKGVYAWAEVADRVIPDDMLSYIRAGAVCREALEQAQEYFERKGAPRQGEERYIFDLDEVKLTAPIPFPVSLRDHSAYLQHIQSSMGGDLPEVFRRRPPCYRGSTTNSITTGDPIVWCAGSQFLDYETEIAMVVGEYGYEIKKEHALEHIFGLMIFNDVSARDIQVDEKQLSLGPNKGKSFHNCNIFGPYIVTLDEIPDVQNINMKVSVNGEVKGTGNTKNMSFSMAELIEYASRSDALHPGEVIGTGTHGKCAGHEVGYHLKPGDVVEIEMDYLGKLSNVVGPYVEGERVRIPLPRHPA